MKKFKHKILSALFVVALFAAPFAVDAARTQGFWKSVGSYLETTKSSGYNVLINGISKYLNFNTISGFSGYGFRDNAGTMEVKDSGGAWADFASLGGAGTLAEVSTGSDDATKSLYTMTSAVDVEFETSANATLFYLDEANVKVGVGTNTPDQQLHVKSSGTTTVHFEGGSNVGLELDKAGLNRSAQVRYQVAGADQWYAGTSDSGDAGTGAEYFIGQSSGGAGSALWIDTSNYVGIGTTSPQSLLDVQAAAGSAGTLTLASKELTVVDGDVLGKINFNAPLESDGTDAILVGASIWAEADSTFGIADNSTELVFATGSSETATEKVRITSDGKLGIGTSAPSAFLHSAGTTEQLRLTATGSNRLSFAVDNRTDITWVGTSGTMVLSGRGNGLHIGTAGANAAAMLDVLSTTEQLRLGYDASNYFSDTIASDGGRSIAGLGTDADLNIDFSGATDGDFSVNTDDLFVDTSTGRVGVGVSSPSESLDVAGSINIANGSYLKWRNNADSANVNAFLVDSNDNLQAQGVWQFPSGLKTDLIQNRSSHLNIKATNAVNIIFSTNAVARMTIGADGSEDGISITPDGLTSAEATSALNLAQTWNTTGTPTAINLDVTDTASNSASKLMDLQVDSSSVFNVDKAGAVTTTGSLDVGGNAVSAGSFSVNGGGSYFINNSAKGGRIYSTDNSSRSGFLFTDTNVTGAVFLQIGGTTSSFPAIKRSTTDIHFRLADDSADTGIQAGNITSTGKVVTSTVTTLANDATPSVSASNLFKTGGAVTITDLDDGVVGQTIQILSAHAVTITDGTNILLDGSANFVMATGDTLTLTMFNDQVWEEVSRKVD